jgi:hypothetical protein
MKKKSPRGIPDFSRQASRPKDAPRPGDAQAPSKGGTRAPAPAPRVKPQSTSAKSGQRGQ